MVEDCQKILRFMLLYFLFKLLLQVFWRLISLRFWMINNSHTCTCWIIQLLSIVKSHSIHMLTQQEVRNQPNLWLEEKKSSCSAKKRNQNYFLNIKICHYNWGFPYLTKQSTKRGIKPQTTLSLSN